MYGGLNIVQNLVQKLCRIKWATYVLENVRGERTSFRTIALLGQSSGRRAMGRRRCVDSIGRESLGFQEYRKMRLQIERYGERRVS